MAISVIAASLISCGSDDATDSSGAEDAASQDDSTGQSVSPFGDDDVGQLREILANYGAPIDETACVAEELVDEVSPEELTALLDAVEADDQAAADPDVGLAFADATAACGLT